jgi:hypothetical protein
MLPKMMPNNKLNQKKRNKKNISRNNCKRRNKSRSHKMKKLNWLKVLRLQLMLTKIVKIISSQFQMIKKNMKL